MTTMTDSEALAVLGRAINSATINASTHPSSEILAAHRDGLIAARAHIAEALRDAARYRYLLRDHGLAWEADIDAAMKDDHA